MTNAFDSATNSQVFTVTGTGFPADENLSGVSLYIDDVKQETLTLTETQATFRITDIATSTPEKVRVYFADGLATDYHSFRTANIVPTLVSVSPSTGSSGGTLVTVTGTGFGMSTSGLNLELASSSTEICEKVSVTGYGTFTCLTKAMEISSSDELNLKVGTDVHACGNSLG